MDQVARQMVQVRDSEPSAWSDYVDEGSEWEQGAIDPVGP